MEAVTVLMPVMESTPVTVATADGFEAAMLISCAEAKSNPSAIATSTGVDSTC